VDSVYQADRAWLLNIQRKLHRWSRENPDFALTEPESPVQIESCTPGLGTGVGETTAGNCGTGAPAPCSRALCNPRGRDALATDPRGELMDDRHSKEVPPM
jgi:hypothetical protein